MAEARAVEGLGIRPIREFIYVADLGQPNMSKGGILFGNYEWAAYRVDEWRFGEVIAIGPGAYGPDGSRLPMPDLNLGDVVAFSRKHGSRTDLRYIHPTYTKASYAHGPDNDLDGLLIRVLDPDKAVLVIENFEPWWDPDECTPRSPGTWFSG